MQVKLTVSRRDVAWFNISRALRPKVRLKVLAFMLFVGTIASLGGAMSEDGDIVWPAFAIGLIIAVVIGCAAIFLLPFLFAFLGSSQKSGGVGEHTYTIEEDGLRVLTGEDENLNVWESIERIIKTGTGIYVQVSSLVFYVLPSRRFSSRDEYEAFFSALRSRCQSKISS